MSSLLSKALVTPQKHLPVTPPQKPPHYYNCLALVVRVFVKNFTHRFLLLAADTYKLTVLQPQTM